MNKNYCVLFIFFFVTLFSYSVFAQIHHRIVKYAGPLSTGNVERFNDIWGYTRPDGREYAVIGARTAIRIYDITEPR
nr:hypothetical protein [Saprospiraceae bacterium]